MHYNELHNILAVKPLVNIYNPSYLNISLILTSPPPIYFLMTQTSIELLNNDDMTALITEPKTT
jgi:hypothetical protein